MAGRVVVGVDGSEHAAAALRWAAEEARLRGAPLVVVHAWSYMPPVPVAEPGMVPMPAIGMPESLDAQRDVAGTALESAVDDLLPEGLQVEQLLVEGAPADVLCETVDEDDLLVVGTRGHGDIASAFLGSVSHDVVRHAACPVVIVHARRE